LPWPWPGGESRFGRCRSARTEYGRNAFEDDLVSQIGPTDIFKGLPGPKSTPTPGNLGDTGKQGRMMLGRDRFCKSSPSQPAVVMTPPQQGQYFGFGKSLARGGGYPGCRAGLAGFPTATTATTASTAPTTGDRISRARLFGCRGCRHHSHDSGQRSAASGQRPAVSGQRSAVAAIVTVATIAAALCSGHPARDMHSASTE
jgi:hypothetical protein